MTAGVPKGGALLLLMTIVSACGLDPNKRLARMHLPLQSYVADASRGAPLFQRTCADCHGTGAQGTGRGPPLVHSLYRPSHHADLAFHWAVRDGVQAHHWGFGDMPAQLHVSPTQAADIIAWVRESQLAVFP